MSDLVEQIDALLALNAKGAVSHPVPGLAVELLERAKVALSRPSQNAEVLVKPTEALMRHVHKLLAYHITKPPTLDHEFVNVCNGDLRVLADLFADAALTPPAVSAGEAEPVAWVDPRSIEALKDRQRWTTVIMTNQAGENATMPLYAAPLPQVDEGMLRKAREALGVLGHAEWATPEHAESILHDWLHRDGYNSIFALLAALNQPGGE